MNDYYGHKAARLENDHLALDYLTEAGPRVVRLIPKALGVNLLAELPDANLPSPYGPYHLLGGHRMWHAPENSARTYVPDDSGVVARPLAARAAAEGVVLTRDEPHTGIRKELAITLDPAAASVRLVHRYTNIGLWPIELAPWAITQFTLGGTAVLPQHNAPLDAEGLLPNRHFALWPYASLRDERLSLSDDLVRVAARPVQRPFKIGIFNHAGWLAYETQGLTFRKEFAPQPGRPHPDMGCNAEVYANGLFIELETLGPLVVLAAGETAEHAERWLIT